MERRGSSMRLLRLAGLEKQSRRGACEQGPEHGDPNRSFFLPYCRGRRAVRDDSFHNPSVQKWPDDHNSPDRTNGLC